MPNARTVATFDPAALAASVERLELRVAALEETIAGIRLQPDGRIAGETADSVGLQAADTPGNRWTAADGVTFSGRTLIALGGAYPQSVNKAGQPYPGLAASTVDLIKQNKVQYLVDWVRAHRDQRVLIFTEYADTKRYLERQLRVAPQCMIRPEADVAVLVVRQLLQFLGKVDVGFFVRRCSELART